jgi:hypothetical protein
MTDTAGSCRIYQRAGEVVGGYFTVADYIKRHMTIGAGHPGRKMSAAQVKLVVRVSQLGQAGPGKVVQPLRFRRICFKVGFNLSDTGFPVPGNAYFACFQGGIVSNVTLTLK